MGTHLDQVIAIDLIAEELLKNLSTKDLLTCALLSKEWNRIARDYLYRKEKHTIQLVLVENRESNLERLHWLQNSTQRVFKQLSISIFSCYSKHECEQDFWPLLHQLEESTIIAPGLTHLEVSDNCSHEDKCEATAFLKSVIRHLPQNSVSHLNARYVKDFNSVFMEKGDFIFPNLQSANVSSENLDKLHLIPSLEEFSGEINSLQLETVLEQGKAHTVKHLTLDFLPNSENSAMEILSKFAEEGPNLKSLTIFDTKVRDLSWNHKKLTEFIQLLLESSFLTLEKLFCKVDLQVLNTIWAISGKSFPRVRSFVFPQQQLFEAEILGTIPLSKLFPNLSTVIVSHIKHFKIDRDVLLDVGELNGNETCCTVKTLVFSQSKYQYRFRTEYNKILAKIFPKVKYLTYEFVKDEQELISVCSSLWPGIWPELEHVSISVIPSQLFACEWSFLGISKQEWGHWVDLKKTGVNLTMMQFAASDDSLANFTDIDFIVRIFSKANPIPRSPSELLELVELQANVFRVTTCIGSAVTPIPTSAGPAHPLSSRLINGIQNQISRFLRIG